MPVLGEQGVQNASSYHDLFKIWKYFSKWSSFFKNQSCPTERLPSKIMIHIIKDTPRYFKKNKSFKNQLKNFK